MSEMIERVARAMAKRGHEGPECWEDMGQETQTTYLLDAHAAIESMRVPTEDLHAAAEEISVYYDDFSCGDGNITLGLPGYRAKFSGVWSQLIDAALATTSKES